MITPKLIIRYINDRWKKRIVGDEMPLDIQKEAIELIEEYAQYKVNELNKSDVKSNEAIQSENKKESEVAVCGCTRHWGTFMGADNKYRCTKCFGLTAN